MNTARLGAVLLAINQFLYKLPIEQSIIKEWRCEIETLFEQRIEVENFWGIMGIPGGPEDHSLWIDNVDSFKERKHNEI